MKQCKLNLFPECPGYCPTGASFSQDGQYRYDLWRKWGTGEDITFIGLNPSTANREKDDPTIRRLKSFAKSWGYDGFHINNLFALVTAYPSELVSHPKPISETQGSDIMDINDNHLLFSFDSSKTIVLCWGSWNYPLIRERAKEVTDELKGEYWKNLKVMCFGLNKDGQPKHPLYLKGDTKLIPFN